MSSKPPTEDPPKPPSRGRRFMKLASMSASVAGNYAKSRISTAFSSDERAAEVRDSVNRANGERIAETLGQLKGAAMKIGQMASMESDILPRELSGALKKLQKDAPPMSWSTVAEQIEAEFGMIPERLFDDFDEEPFAAASIGQVHRAVVDDGRQVIVKVQYPGVDDSVDSDLQHLKFALRASGLMNRAHRRAFDALFEELRARLHEELDYGAEADNLRLLRAHHAGDERIILPRVVGERSARRVLTLTYEPGLSLDEASELSQDRRNIIGENMMHMVLGQIFKAQAIHADPNPGNFAFRDDGRIVLYDYGCVKELVPDIVSAWGRTIRAGLAYDLDEVERGLVALGGRNPEVELDPEFYRPWAELFLEPLRGGTYDYGASTLQERAVDLMPAFFRRINAFQPPVELVFVDRVMKGHFQMLKRLGVRGDYRELFERHVALVL